MTDEQPLTRRAARQAAGRPVAPEAPSPTRPSRASINDLIARHPKAWLFSTLGVVFLLLGTGAVFTGVAVGSGASADVIASPSPTPTVEPPRPVPSAAAPATALRTCSIAALTQDPRLLTFAGSVINAASGEVLFNRSADAGAPPASVLKVLTAAAALVTIGPDYRMTTRVYEGSAPGSIVLVGGGDPTLTVLGAGVESYYTGAPKIDDLAAQVKAKWSETHEEDDPITSVILDATMWNPSDRWLSSWERSEQSEGYQPEITALMVDGDRANPLRGTSPRGSDPIGRAGNAFVSALGLDTAPSISTGSALPGKPLLGEVKSQPIRVLISQMLLPSDNTIAEMMARVISKESGGGGSSASLATIIPGALAKYGLSTTGLVIRDGSGLSAENLVPPEFVAALMVKIINGEQSLRVVLDALPVAGKSGSLASRFGGGNAIARGSVFAKTGWIKSSRTLAGIVHAADGTPLAFAFYALGPVRSNATDALDTVTTGAYTCGNNLSNN